jgi:F-type H+-transporting ATPase subunit delta
MKAIRLYAQVLIDVAQAPASGLDLQAVMADLRSFSASFNESQIAQKAFESPVVTEEEKGRILVAWCDRIGISPVAKRFLSMLARKGRLDSLEQIIKEAEALQIERKGGLIGEVVSAVPLDAAVLSGVIEALSKRLQKQVHLNTRVDPSVIAGMKVTIHGVTYDGTVRAKLDRMAANG